MLWVTDLKIRNWVTGRRTIDHSFFYPESYHQLFNTLRDRKWPFFLRLTDDLAMKNPEILLKMVIHIPELLLNYLFGIRPVGRRIKRTQRTPQLRPFSGIENDQSFNTWKAAGVMRHHETMSTWRFMNMIKIHVLLKQSSVPSWKQTFAHTFAKFEQHSFSKTLISSKFSIGRWPTDLTTVMWWYLHVTPWPMKSQSNHHFFKSVT